MFLSVVHLLICEWLVGMCSPHIPHSPDMAPSDFHLFGTLKDALRGTRFEDDESVIRAVRIMTT